MSQHDPVVRLRHMHAHAVETIALIAQISPETFRSDRVLQLAVVRRLEIVGEAANRTPESVRIQHPHVPWRQMSGLRNRLIHGYDGVDLDIVWAILANDLPQLVADLDEIIRRFDADNG